MKKFEYKVEYNLFTDKNSFWSTDRIEKYLNSLGEYGWELIRIEDKVFYFKREISEEDIKRAEHEERIQRMEKEEHERYKNGDFEKAEELYNKVIAKNPKLKGMQGFNVLLEPVKKGEISYEVYEERVKRYIDLIF